MMASRSSCVSTHFLHEAFPPLPRPPCLWTKILSSLFRARITSHGLDLSAYMAAASSLPENGPHASVSTLPACGESVCLADGGASARGGWWPGGEKAVADCFWALCVGNPGHPLGCQRGPPRRRRKTQSSEPPSALQPSQRERLEQAVWCCSPPGLRRRWWRSLPVAWSECLV